VVITANIITHSTPAVSINTGSTVSYEQLVNSLGTQVYKIRGYYIYCSVFSQLISQILYNRYDINGNSKSLTIAQMYDPYMYTNSMYVDTEAYDESIVLNGNSSLATTLLPNSYIQIHFYCKRVTNSFGNNLNNFEALEKAMGTKFFSYGTTPTAIKSQNVSIEESATVKNFSGDGSDSSTPNSGFVGITPVNKIITPAISIGVLALTALGTYYLIKNK